MQGTRFNAACLLLGLLLTPGVGMADITTNLGFRYVMNDNAATTTVVETVSANNGVLTGGNTADKTTTGPGVTLTAALDLDGTGDYITNNANVRAYITTAADRTVAVWFRIDSYAGVDELYILSNRVSATNQLSILWDDDNDCFGALAIDATGTVTTSVTGGQALLGSGWHHVAVVWTQATRTLTVYLDGVTIGTGTTVITPAMSSNVSILGGNTAGAENFNGPMADFRGYARALSVGDVGELYALGHTSGSTLPPVSTATLSNSLGL